MEIVRRLPVSDQQTFRQVSRACFMDIEFMPADPLGYGLVHDVPEFINAGLSDLPPRHNEIYDRVWRLATASSIKHLPKSPLRTSIGFIGLCSVLCGRLDLLQWAVTQGYVCTTGDFAYAAIRGYVEIILWMKSKGFEWDSWCCLGAASFGQLQALKCLRRNGCPWERKACLSASENYPLMYAWILKHFDD